MLFGLRTAIHPVTDLTPANARCQEMLGAAPCFGELFYINFLWADSNWDSLLTVLRLDPN